jgi:ribose transport system substrate-binding protein
MMKKVMSLLLITLLIFSLIGCSVDNPSQNEEASSSKSEEAPNNDKTAKVKKKDPKDMVFAISLGWMENESGQRQKYAFETAIKELGGTYSIVDANYDAKKQSEQIEAFIKAKPDALFITPSDPVGISEAVKHAIDAGIPVFCSDGFVPGAAVTTTVAFDNFAGGAWTMEQICQKLGGKGKIAVIDLPSNEGWDARGQGAKWTLQQYPDIEIVQRWSWDSTGAVTPRMAIDNMLTACPNKGDLDAIWCAWDGAVFEGIQAVKAAGREEILFTGSDGGEHCFEVMKQSPNFIGTVGESVYTMAYQCVFYAHQYLRGEAVPRVVMAPGIGITRDMILNVKVPEDWNGIGDYDIPGNFKKIGWVPTI